MVVGEPEIEIKNVPYLVTDEGYKVACESLGLRGGGRDPVEKHTYIHALHIYSKTKLGRHGRNGANLKRIDIGIVV
jgi:hypothetical protein